MGCPSGCIVLAISSSSAVRSRKNGSPSSTPKFVNIPPGQMQFARIPNGAPSIASVHVDQAVEVGIGVLLEEDAPAGRCDPRVVEHHVELAVGLDRGADGDVD